MPPSCRFSDVNSVKTAEIVHDLIPWIFPSGSNQAGLAVAAGFLKQVLQMDSRRAISDVCGVRVLRKPLPVQ